MAIGGGRMISLPLLGLFLSLSLLLSPALAVKKSYIVYLGRHLHGPDASTNDFVRVANSHYELLGSYVGSKAKAQEAIVYSYKKHINGFAAVLEEEQAMQLKNHPDVISVFQDELKQLHTTRTWQMLGMETDGKFPSMSIWPRSDFGQDTIIATLDTGVWPEAESFNDEGFGEIPLRWRGSCESKSISGVTCNRKLIGAKVFNKGSSAAGEKIITSVRDIEGHGTHTLSTAGGSFVPAANIFGYANGTAKGGSPRARVAAYKVCGENGCYSSDILAGFDEAIHDGVDVISVSLGGLAFDFITDPTAVGAFHAVSAGITVVCSAGNSGPSLMSIDNTAPWILTVAASTVDRDFPSDLSLGNNKTIKGVSLSDKFLDVNKFYPLINSEDAKLDNATVDDAQLCFLDTLDPEKVKGKIVLCLRGTSPRVEKGEAVRKAGGAGMVLMNEETNADGIIADAHILPATSIGYKDGLVVKSYINSTKTPVAYISAPKTVLNVEPSPSVASFSSRGPGLITPEILKPDITAPGVSVLAAFTQATGPSGLPSDKRRVPFTIMSGTSMSCPHVSGIVGLLRTLYPHWSPAAIKSAIMTTARSRDNTGKPIKDSDLSKATPFAYGSGHVRPNRAMDPGLVYDITVDDYLNFLCTFGYNETQLTKFSSPYYRCPSEPMKLEDLNYPSISVPALMNGTQTVTRTLKNVGSPGTYKVRVEAPLGVSISIEPEVLEFAKVGEEKSFKITLKSEDATSESGFVFGRLIWSDGIHYVRSPLVVYTSP